jgi:hypothetical protein
MAASVGTEVIDNGLATLDTLADEIHILSAEPANYAAIASTTLGKKTFAPGVGINSPVAATSPTGRKVLTVHIGDGSVTGSGTASHWAIIATSGTKLLANGQLSSSVAVTSGDTFVLPQFAIQLPSGSL